MKINISKIGLSFFEINSLRSFNRRLMIIKKNSE